MAEDVKNDTSSSSLKPECGIVMPISEIDGCPASHWSEVLGIMTDALASSGFKTQMVSNNGSSPIIQKRIVQSLYFSDLIVCDVSGKNPNVMLELGMRLAFDKPIILVKDDKTAYSFDISPLEHLSYPRDLRFSAIVEFKQKLGEAAIKMVNNAASPNFDGSYLKSFGDFKVAQLDKTEVPGEALVLEELRNLRVLLEGRPQNSKPMIMGQDGFRSIGISASVKDITDAERFRTILMTQPTVSATNIVVRKDDFVDFNITVYADSVLTSAKLGRAIKLYARNKAASNEELSRMIADEMFR